MINEKTNFLHLDNYRDYDRLTDSLVNSIQCLDNNFI